MWQSFLFPDVRWVFFGYPFGGSISFTDLFPLEGARGAEEARREPEPPLAQDIVHVAGWATLDCAGHA